MRKQIFTWPTLDTSQGKLSFLTHFFGYRRRYGNSTIQTLLSAKEGPSQGGSSQRITIVPPLSAAWFSDIVIPAVIVSIVVVVSLFAIVVLLLLRRHIQLEGHEGWNTVTIPSAFIIQTPIFQGCIIASMMTATP